MTTIRQQLTEMAVAGTMVVALARGEVPSSNRLELSTTTLVVRGSTVPLSQAGVERLDGRG